MSMETKTCCKCGEVKALGEYSFRKDENRYASHCKKCVCERTNKWNLENPERRTEKDKMWHSKNRHKSNTHKYQWMKKNKDKWHAAQAINNKKQIDELRDAYVASQLGMRVKDAPPSLIELKRQQLLIHRATKQLIETIKEKQDEH